MNAFTPAFRAELAASTATRPGLTGAHLNRAAEAVLPTGHVIEVRRSGVRLLRFVGTKPRPLFLRDVAAKLYREASEDLALAALYERELTAAGFDVAALIDVLRSDSEI